MFAFCDAGSQVTMHVFYAFRSSFSLNSEESRKVSFIVNISMPIFVNSMNLIGVPIILRHSASIGRAENLKNFVN